MKGPFGMAPMAQTRVQLHGKLDAPEPCECDECVKSGHGKPSVLAYVGTVRGIEHGQWIHGTELKILWERRALLMQTMSNLRTMEGGEKR